jgi:hypothetical protein
MAELKKEKELDPKATKVKRAPTKSSKKVVKVGSKFKSKDVTNGDGGGNGRDPDKEPAKVPTKGPDKFVKPTKAPQVVIRPPKPPKDPKDPTNPINPIEPDPQEQPIKVPSNLTFTDSTPVPTVAEEAEILANLAPNTRKNQNSVGLPVVSGATARTATTGFIANQEGLLGYASPVVFNNVVDGVISESELTQKVFNLQCQYKDLVYAITNKWRYGIFCSDDKDLIVEIRALLKLLVCYGVEGTAISAGTDISEFSQNYADYITFGGIDLNNFAFFPPGVTEGDYLFITSPFTEQYYIILVDGGTLEAGAQVSTANILNLLDQGWPGVASTSYGITWPVLETGNQVDLDDALDAQEGVEIFASGLPDATLIKIVNKIEKLLQCSH